MRIGRFIVIFGVLFAILPVGSNFVLNVLWHLIREVLPALDRLMRLITMLALWLVLA